jgi:hypothetical protein
VSRSDRLGPALLLALLAVSLLTAVLVYHDRTPDLALEVTEIPRHLSPDDDGEKDLAPIAFFVRFDEPDATVEIVGRNKKLVRTLADPIALTEHQEVHCVWDGRDDEGEFALRGKYRLRVILPGQDRDMVFPKRITLERKDEDAAPPPRDPGCEASG